MIGSLLNLMSASNQEFHRTAPKTAKILIWVLFASVLVGVCYDASPNQEVMKTFGWF